MGEFWKWLSENLFTHSFFDNKFFPQETVLYQHTPSASLANHWLHMEQQFTREDLYTAVTKACGVHRLKREATWFHVNVIDQCVWQLEAYKKYPYPPQEAPLATLFARMEQHPAAEAGTTYVGLLGGDKDWLLLVEKGANFKGADFKITLCGSQAFCDTAHSFLNSIMK